jgi:hypothetical protein
MGLAAEDATFQLLPVEAEPATAEEILDAAEESALEDPLAVEAPATKPIPFGRSWEWDEVRGRFVRGMGGGPIDVRGLEALQEWIKTVASTAAGVHPIFSPGFGIEDPDDFIGLVDPREVAADYEERFRTALVANHERIAEVDEFEIEWDPTEGVLTIPAFDVITDAGEAVSISEFQVRPEA